jgi:single-stranded-DNA-specific exonuclease
MNLFSGINTTNRSANLAEDHSSDARASAGLSANNRVALPSELTSSEIVQASRLQGEGFSERQSEFMVRRGLTAPDLVYTFLQPTPPSIQEIMAVPGVIKAVERVLLARERKEKVAVFGDFDVDGITAAAIVVETLRSLDLEPHFDTPCRRKEGYGMNFRLVDDAHAKGASLIIAVDIGTTQNKVIGYAESKGIETIVIDHHQSGDFMPPRCAALINPNSTHLKGEFGSMCAAGLSLLWAIAVQSRSGLEPDLEPLFALAAVGTIADVASLSSQANRAVVIQGLRAINKHPKLKQLCDLLELDSAAIKASDIAFKLGPTLNAPGRIEAHHRDTPSGALACYHFMTAQDAKTTKLAHQIIRANRDRKERELHDYELANDWVSRLPRPLPRALVFASEFIDAGLAGLIAARLTQAYQRPAAVIALDGRYGRGSVRAGESDFDVYSALQGCSKWLTNFGGHTAAGGFKIDTAKIESFRLAFAKTAQKQLGSFQLPKIKADLSMSLAEFVACKQRLAAELRIFEPFGSSNPPPLIAITDVQIESAMLLGREHFRLTLRDGGVTQQAYLWRGRGSPLSKRVQHPVTIAARLSSEDKESGPEAVLEVIG